MNRAAHLVVAAQFAALIFSLNANAQTTYADGPWQFEVNNANEAVLTRYTGTQPVSGFPGTVTNGAGVSFPVVQLGNGNDRLASDGIMMDSVVVVPNGVRNIADWAFYGSYSYGEYSISLPTTLTNIGAEAFASSTVSWVDVLGDNANLRNIGDNAFSWCTKLNSASWIPGSVTNIGSSAFRYTSVWSVNIPAGVKSVGQYAFGDCTNLGSVSLGFGTAPDGPVSISSTAFEWIIPISGPRRPLQISVGRWLSDGLETLFPIYSPMNLQWSSLYFSVQTNNPAYSSREGVLYDKEKRTVFSYPDRSSVSYYGISVTNLPDWVLDGVTTIADGAFAYATLGQVDIPNTVTSMGAKAFFYCSASNIVVHGSVTNIGADAFRVFAWAGDSAPTRKIYLLGDAPAMDRDALGGYNENFILHTMPGTVGYNSQTNYSISTVGTNQNANLQMLSLDGTPIAPAFSVGRTVYTANVGLATESVLLGATAQNPSSSVQWRVNGGTNISMAPNVTVPLNVGTNRIDVFVTSPGGYTGGSGYPGYPSYPGDPNYPGYPGYPSYPGDPNYPGYPTNSSAYEEPVTKTYSILVTRSESVTPTPPTVNSPSSSAVTTKTATLGGNVVTTGGAPVTERGVVYALTVANTNPFIGGSGVTKVSTSGTTGTFTVAVAGLSFGSSYSFKAYAMNSEGVGYSDAGSFATIGTDSDSDGDGLNDAAEYEMSALGFNWQVAQTNLVSSLINNIGLANFYGVAELDANRVAGRSDVTGNPGAYGLYTSNSIMDLRMGGLMIQKQGANAIVLMQIQASTNLAAPNSFTNFGGPITNTVPMPGDKGFIRIQAKPDPATAP